MTPPEEDTSERTTSLSFHETSPYHVETEKCPYFPPKYHDPDTQKKPILFGAQAIMKMNGIRWWVGVIPRLSARFLLRVFLCNNMAE